MKQKTKSVLIRKMPLPLHTKLKEAGQESRAKLQGEILNRLEKSFEEGE